MTDIDNRQPLPFAPSTELKRIAILTGEVFVVPQRHPWLKQVFQL